MTLTGSVATGSWRSYPVAGDFSQILETDSRVWYVTGGRLNSYDLSADETRVYESGSELGGFTVQRLYHNPAMGFIAVVFDDSAIDIIYEDDGSVMHLPDIRDASVNAGRGINDIAFKDHLMYVATDFGLVIYDINSGDVRESGVYNGQGILSMAPLTDGMVMVPTGGAPFPIIFHPWGGRIGKLEYFRVLREDISGLMSDLTPLEGNRVAYLQYGQAKLLKVNDTATAISFGNIFTESGHRIASFMPASDGGLYFTTSGGLLLHAASDGALSPTRFTIPESLRSDVIATRRGPERSLWAGSNRGLGQYRLSADGALTTLRDKSIPTDATTFPAIGRLYPGATDSEFIIATIGTNRYNPAGTGDRTDVRMMANVYSGGTFTPLDPSGVSAVTSTGVAQQEATGAYIYSPTWIAADPDVEGRYYVASGVEGLYVIEDGKEKVRFDDTNSRLYHGWVVPVPFVTIDHQGNLWVMSSTGGTAGATPVSMLPAAKRRGDLSKIKTSDWVAVNFGGNINDKDGHLLFCRQSNIVLAFDSKGSYALEALMHNGTIADTQGHSRIGWATVTDTDGKAFSPGYWTCAVEDRRGQIWIGTSSGVVTIPNPASVMTTSFAVNRVKVPRNDGTNLADYLLESDLILDIAVDHSNRKWIATRSSGLYLVSENGDEILAVYDTSNSPLPTNAITGVHVDPGSNSVFVSTLSGLFEVASTSGPASEDYSEVIAYPNPLTPDYSGLVTITGLMDNSAVKIVDSDMHLVYQTTSEGGMATWDGTNLAGVRVRTGVYYVLASSSTGSSSKGAVATKILVVN